MRCFISWSLPVYWDSTSRPGWGLVMGLWPDLMNTFCMLTRLGDFSCSQFGSAGINMSPAPPTPTPPPCSLPLRVWTHNIFITCSAPEAVGGALFNGNKDEIMLVSDWFTHMIDHMTTWEFLHLFLSHYKNMSFWPLSCSDGSLMTPPPVGHMVSPVSTFCSHWFPHFYPHSSVLLTQSWGSDKKRGICKQTCKFSLFFKHTVWRQLQLYTSVSSLWCGLHPVVSFFLQRRGGQGLWVYHSLLACLLECCRGGYQIDWNSAHSETSST